MIFLRSHWLLVASIALVYLMAFFYISLADPGMFDVEGYPIHNGGDSGEYALLAKNLALHGTFSLDLVTPEMFRAPGYPLFLAPLYALDHSFYLVIFIQVLLVIGSALLICKIGERFLPPPWPAAVALVYALDPTTIFYSLSLWSDIPFVFLVLLAIYLLFMRHRMVSSKQGWVEIVLAGVVLGFATLARFAGEHLIWIAALFLIFDRAQHIGYKKAILSALVFALAAGVVLFPWYVRNYEVSGGAVGLSSVGPYALLFFDVRDFLVLNKGITPEAADAEILGKLPTTDKRELRNLKYAEAEMALVKNYILESPLAYGIFHLTGSVKLFLGSGLRDLSLNLPNLSGALSPPLLLNAERLVRALLLFLALIGFLSVYRPSPHRPLILLMSALILYTALSIGPVAYPRYRLSLEPFLLLLSALGALTLLACKRRRFSASITTPQ